jgi:predicted peptidase
MAKLMSARAVNEVFPEGMKTTAYVLEYDSVMDQTAVDALPITIVDHSYEPAVSAQRRTMIKSYPNSVPERTAQGCAGCYVIAETSLDETAAFAIGNYKMSGEFSPYAPEPVGFPDPNRPKPGPGGPGGPKKPGGPPPDMGYTGPKPFRVSVSDGETEVTCTEWSCKQVERFREGKYEDLPYTFYVPESYDPTQKYPLVLFIPDAGNRGADVRTPLIQGYGGVVWTEPENQAKNPCFVVCPAFGPDEILTKDDFTFNPKMRKAKAIIDALAQEYSIDKNRIYTTGQSMGCMSSCQLIMDDPDYFAGAMLVAGQWDPVGCGKAMKDMNIWILVSCNDMKAHPGMDAVTDEIKKNGGAVAYSSWDASLPVSKQNAAAGEALKEKANIHYTIFEGSTVVPASFADAGPGANHTNTWRVAYQIDTVREWLFTNRK